MVSCFFVNQFFRLKKHTLMNSKISYHPEAAIKIMDCHLLWGEKECFVLFRGTRMKEANLINNKELCIKIQDSKFGHSNSLFHKYLW